MSSLGRGEWAWAFGLAAGEEAPPGMRGRGPAQMPGQRGERREGGTRFGATTGARRASLGRRGPGGAEAGGALRDQEERGRGRERGGQAAALVGDEQAAVEAFGQRHATAGVRAAVRAARDLHDAWPESDGVVAGDASGVAAAEAIGEIARGRAPRGAGDGGRAREAAVVVQEIRRQLGLGGREGLQTAQPELGDDAIERFGIACHRDDVQAVFGEAPGDGGADAA